jgi:hypothetical protein
VMVSYQCSVRFMVVSFRWQIADRRPRTAEK